MPLGTHRSISKHRAPQPAAAKHRAPRPSRRAAGAVLAALTLSLAAIGGSTALAAGGGQSKPHVAKKCRGSHWLCPTNSSTASTSTSSSTTTAPSTATQTATSTATSTAVKTATSTAPATPTQTPTSTAPSSPASGSSCAGAAPPAVYDHVVWVWFENKAPVVGSSSAPYFTSLAGSCGLASNYHGITHPSLPNYLAATGGSTFGVTDDNPPSSHPISAGSIFSQVAAAGKQWRSYQESMPANCALTSSGSYAVKHNPAAYYTGIRTDCASRDVPMGTTAGGPFLDALRNNTLPAFSFVTPNMCNDMHDCSVSTGDAWLSSWMKQVLSSPSYTAGRTAVVVTFDEDDRSGGNLVSTIVVAPGVRPGTVSSTAFDHYSLLRTTEEMLGLPTTLGNASTATSMRSAFHL